MKAAPRNTSHTTISTEAYVKTFLHAAKYFGCAVGGYLVGSCREVDAKKVTEVEDCIPVFHNCPAGAIFEIAGDMTGKIYEGRFDIVGFYYANAGVSDINPPAYLASIQSAIKKNNGSGTCVTIRLNNTDLADKTDLCMHATGPSGESMVLKQAANVTVTDVHAVVDTFLRRDLHLSLVDVEDHMNSPAATSLDFRNKFVAKELKRS